MTALFKDWQKRGQVRVQKARRGSEGEAQSAAKPAADGGDMMAELKGRSAFFKKVEAQAAEYGPKLEELAEIITALKPSSQSDLKAFHTGHP